MWAHLLLDFISNQWCFQEINYCSYSVVCVTGHTPFDPKIKWEFYNLKNTLAQIPDHDVLGA